MDAGEPANLAERRLFGRRGAVVELWVLRIRWGSYPFRRHQSSTCRHHLPVWSFAFSVFRQHVHYENVLPGIIIKIGNITTHGNCSSGAGDNGWYSPGTFHPAG